MSDALTIYDELLVEIGDNTERTNNALIAVVKLHKPFDFKLGEEMYTSCEGCGHPDYPCTTIQAIEKELG